MKITDIKTHILLDPGMDATATSSNQDTIVVEVETDEGITGVGETDLNAWVARACIEAPGTHTMDRGLRQMLIGSDPTDPKARWQEMYVGSAMTGRRGAVIHALGALDMALWDIAGKAAGVPTWQLLGDARPEGHLVPYASLLPNAGSDYDAFAASIGGQAIAAAKNGFRAGKLELLTRGPYAHTGLAVADERMVEIIAEVRRATGPDFTIMVDVAYGWDNWRQALAVIETWAEYNVYFVETPIWTDDLDGYAELARHSPIPLAAGEWLATRYEFQAYVDRQALHVLQPDVGRVGGITEALEVTKIAAANDLLVVPHGWKTGITVAATSHLAAVTPCLPFFEFVPPAIAESRLRRELVNDELELRSDGTLALPTRPGLGIELNRDAMAEFEAAGARL
ncbi:MAG: mandelate racemase/muconate lactonizing enzyme family protein [Actinomycetes bacterium]